MCWGGARPGHRIVVAAGTDELRRLVTVLNSLLARIDAALDAQRQFLADAGHAIKTPLTILRGDVDVALRRARTSDEYRQVLAQALEDVRVISNLAEDLIALARSDSAEVLPTERSVAVQPLLERVARKFRRTADRAGIGLIIGDAGELHVAGDPTLLERALGNLVDNAVNYGSRPGGRLRVSALPTPDNYVSLEVADDGPGVSLADLPFLFTRFFRAHASRSTVPGTGLGLAIVRAIAGQLGGTVDVRSTLGLGTTATLVCRRSVPRGPDHPTASEGMVAP